jgi:rod shape-determining protein MreD
MSWLNSIFILTAAWLGVYLESAVDLPRRWFGAQVDVLPALIVYAALRRSLVTVVLLAFLGGLCFDSLSANNPGVSTLSLLAAGLVLHRFRGLLLRDEWIAQFSLGAGASLLCPLVSLLLLMSLGNTPLLAWSSVWQLLFMAVGGGVCAPLFFRLFPWLNRAFNYQPAPEPGFRADRQIKRGRS